MENLLPATFLELLGGALAAVAVGAGLMSLCADLRVHLLKLLAILIICSLALFSNNVSTYFVAIFVIATAVTELDFLQNLAAIIRGNKEYFDYRKEQLSRERRLDSLATEMKQTDTVSSAPIDESEEPVTPVAAADIGNSVAANSRPRAGAGSDVDLAPPIESHDDTPLPEKLDDEIVFVKKATPDLSKASFSLKVKRIFEYESKALDKLEDIYGAAIERGVRLVSKDGAQVELDGLLVSGSHPDTIFEIKYLGSSKNFISWIQLVSKQINRTRSLYLQITKKNPVIHFVLVLEDGNTLTARQRDELLNMSADTCSIFSPSALGFKA